jgi:hypothetical protein
MSGNRFTRRGRALSSLRLLLLAGVVAGLAPVALAAEDDPIAARAFEVHYRDLSDAAELVGVTLSEEGSITLKPSLRTLVVEDRRSVLDRVALLLESFDLPPREVEVTLSLFLGQREDDPAEPGAATSGHGALSTEVRGMVESLGDFTKWTSYELLGSRSISGVEGDPVLVDVAGDYRVGFTVDSVVERQGITRIKFDRFSLNREVLLGDGGRDIEELYTAGMVVEAHKLTLVVAASAPDSKRALFLALQVSPR